MNLPQPERVFCIPAAVEELQCAIAAAPDKEPLIRALRDSAKMLRAVGGGYAVLIARKLLAYAAALEADDRV